MASRPQSMASGGDYVWDIATVFPMQGGWSEEEYLSFTDGINNLIEFTDGRIEVLPTPSVNHEYLVRSLFLLLYQFVSARGLGEAFSNGIRVRTRAAQYRMPDVVFLRNDNLGVQRKRIWNGADLAMEIVSDDPNDQKRDYETKLVDYAKAGISEYWIVDPQQRIVQVHRLDGDQYALHGQFAEGETATSVLLDGFSVDVKALFAVMMDLPE